MTNPTKTQPNKHQLKEMLNDAEQFHPYMVSKGLTEYSLETINRLTKLLQDME